MAHPHTLRAKAFASTLALGLIGAVMATELADARVRPQLGAGYAAPSINAPEAGPVQATLSIAEQDIALLKQRAERTPSPVAGKSSSIAVNPGGKLRVTGTYTKGDFTGGTSGFGLSLQHDQANFLGLGGGNTLWVQYAQGSAGMSQNFGDLTAASGSKGFRVVESLTWQQGPLGGQAVALWETNKNAATGLKTDMVSLGGRASYAVTKNFKLVGELGTSQKKPQGQATQNLTKFTFAPTLSTGPDFWNRPELRLYVTTAKWNSAANAAYGLAGLTGLSNGKTSGSSYGAQVEMWF